MDRALKVLVVGCSSGIGLQVTKLLLKEIEKFEVFCLVRNEEKATKAIGEGAGRVKFIVGDITKKETLEPACQEMGAVMCSVGATTGWRLPGFDLNSPKNVDYLGVKKLSESAASAKVSKFVLVSSIAVTRPLYPVALFLNTAFGLVLYWKLKGENSLRETYKSQKDISYNIVRPGGLTNKEGGKHQLMIAQGDKCSGMISRQDVATVVVACIEDKCTPNATFEIVNGEKNGSLDMDCLKNLTPDKE